MRPCTHLLFRSMCPQGQWARDQAPTLLPRLSFVAHKVRLYPGSNYQGPCLPLVSVLGEVQSVNKEWALESRKVGPAGEKRLVTSRGSGPPPDLTRGGRPPSPEQCTVVSHCLRDPPGRGPGVSASLAFADRGWLTGGEPGAAPGVTLTLSCLCEHRRLLMEPSDSLIGS